MARTIEADIIRGVKVYENYIKRGDAGTGNTNKWAVYANAAGTSPVDGTGGSPNSTLTVTTSSPLAGERSFLFTKNSGASRQGEGFSYDFTINSCDQAKVLAIEFDYAVASGTYVDSDMSVWIYDVTNGVLIQPAPYTILNTGISATWRGTFQTASNSTSYRLIFHVGVSTDSANTIKFDNISISRQPIQYGAPVTDWQSVTMGGTGLTGGSGITTAAKMRRVGDVAEFDVKITWSTVWTGGFTTLTLPAGMTIDTSKIGGGTTSPNYIFGLALFEDSGSGTYHGLVGYNSSTSVLLVASGDDAGTSSFYNANFGVSTTAPFTWANADSITARFSVPIVGWSSSVQMSSDADTRKVYATLNRASSGQSITTGADRKVELNAVIKDSHGAYDPATNYRYSVKVPGTYSFSGQLSGASAAGVATGVLLLYKNGSPYKSNYFYVTNVTSFGIPISFQDDAVSGDYYELYINTLANFTLISSATIYGGSQWDIRMLQGPSQIAASETVAARYYQNTSQTSKNSPIVNFDTKVIDTHGAVTTSDTAWKFTCPIAGKYQVSYYVMATNVTAGSVIYGRLNKGGVLQHRANGYARFNSTTSAIVTATDTVSCLAGEYLDVQIVSDDTSIDTGGGASAETYISITKVGN